MLPTAAARRSVARLLAVVLCLLAWGAPATAATPHNVLLLSSYTRMPAIIEIERGLAAGFAARPDVPVALSVEFLDHARVSGDAYERAFVAYLRDKYMLDPPEVILVAADEALDFLSRHRAELFARVPIVHMAVDSSYRRSSAPLPPDVVGTPVHYEFVGTVEQALRWHPKARRLVVVTGASAWDRRWEERLRAEAARLPRGLAVVFLAGLSSDDLRHRLRTMPPDSIVYTPGFFRDGSGRQFEPHEATRLVVDAASLPVYGAFSSFLGTGLVGGRMPSNEGMGRVGAQTAIALLEGAAPSSLKPAALPAPLLVDWRQVQRWGIPARAVPADAIVRFRAPTLWEAYGDHVLVGCVVMLLQAGLIIALLFERRRRHRTVTALARSEERMRLAAKAAGLSTWVLESDDVKATGRVRAPDRAEPAHTPVVDFRETLARIAPHDRAAVTAALDAARDTNGEFDVEYRVEAPDGAWRWESARGRADHAQPHRLIGVAIDVTQRKRAEIQAEQDRVALYHMTRVSLLGQLSASIAHQLSQPLASILANAEAAQKMIEHDPVDLPELCEIFADIVSQDHYAAQVIRRLGVLFKRGEPRFERLDANDLVRDTIETARSLLTMRNVTVAMQLTPDLPRVSGDRVQLQQLLLNLVVNACDAMANVPDDRRVVTIQTSPEAGMVQLCVADRGSGVSAEAMDKVFEPFWSARPGGMGMGLAVCRSIAEAHRGCLTLSNPPGGGALFCAQLPVALVA